MVRLKAKYNLRKEFSGSLGVGARACNIVEDLNLLLFATEQDIDFLKMVGRKLLNCMRSTGGALTLRKVC